MAAHLVTGARSGIGAALAALLEARGDRVIRLTRADVDLEDLAEVGRWAASLDLTRLDSLCHVAGAVELGAVADFDSRAWQQQLAVNLAAPAALTAALLPALRAGGGTVVFVNSTAGLAANPGWAAYAASKFGLRALADALRAEERDHGVRVTSVFPGRTATAMQEKVHRAEGREYDEAAWIRPETVAAAIAGAIDLPADATVPEIVLRPR